MSPDTTSPLILARDGQPAFEITLPACASATEEFAAEELRQALYAMIGPGARLRGPQNLTKIYLNDHDAAHADGVDCAAIERTTPGLGSEAYHIESREQALYLLGSGPRGVLYAVYALLEALGYRWFTPEISHIPRRPDLCLPGIRLAGAPAFENRDIFNWECRDPLWWVRNRLNGWYTPVPGYMGGNVQYYGFVHTFYGLLPPDEFFEVHPEYYSLTAGQRRRDMAQLCLTNPETLQIVTQRVLERMQEHPQATIFSVSQNDCQGYCECEACRAVAEAEGSQSGPILRFVNAVARETARHYPDKLIDTLAYQYSLDAPCHTIPHPNVRVRLCSINCCQGHRFGDCDHPESRRFLSALEAWARITSQIYIWHYATDFTHYPLPMPDFDELQGNLELYQRNGVRGLFVQGMGEPGGGAESMALRGYVASKLLWQPGQSAWPLVDEFLMAYYGAAAPLVRRYLDIFHDQVRQDASLHPSLYDLPHSRLYDDDLRLPAEQALETAEKLVTGAQRERVRLLRGGLRYARIYRACGNFQIRSDPQRAVYGGTANPADRQEMDDLARLWKKAGIQRIREGEDFDFTLQKLHSRLRDHPLEWLTDGEQRIAVAPTLGGRLLEWQAGGRQWLAAAEPDSTWSVHPYSGGYTEFVALEMYQSRGWGEVYRSARKGRKLSLWVLLGRNLRLSRQLWLEDGKLHIHSRLQNDGPSPIHCAWGVALHLVPPPGAQLAFQDAEGQKLITWESLPSGAGWTLSGEKIPRQAWEIFNEQIAFHHTWEEAKDSRSIERFTLARSDTRPALSLDMRTAWMTLAPGQDLAMRQAMWIGGA